MASLLERLKGKAETRQAAAKADYRSLVEALAAGKDFDEHRAETILRETGWTVEAIESDAQRLRDRLEQRAEVDAWKGKGEAESRQAQDKQSELTREKAEALEVAKKRIDAEYDPKLEAVRVRRQELAEQQDRADRAILALVDTCPGELAVPKPNRNRNPYPSTTDLAREAWRIASAHPKALDPWPAGCEALT